MPRNAVPQSNKLNSSAALETDPAVKHNTSAASASENVGLMAYDKSSKGGKALGGENAAKLDRASDESIYGWADRTKSYGDVEQVARKLGFTDQLKQLKDIHEAASTVRNGREINRGEQLIELLAQLELLVRNGKMASADAHSIIDSIASVARAKSLYGGRFAEGSAQDPEFQKRRRWAVTEAINLSCADEAGRQGYSSLCTATYGSDLGKAELTAAYAGVTVNGEATLQRSGAKIYAHKEAIDFADKSEKHAKLQQFRKINLPSEPALVFLTSIAGYDNADIAGLLENGVTFKDVAKQQQIVTGRQSIWYHEEKPVYLDGNGLASEDPKLKEKGPGMDPRAVIYKMAQENQRNALAELTELDDKGELVVKKTAVGEVIPFSEAVKNPIHISLRWDNPGGQHTFHQGRILGVMSMSTDLSPVDSDGQRIQEEYYIFHHLQGQFNVKDSATGETRLAGPGDILDCGKFKMAAWHQGLVLVRKSDVEKNLFGLSLVTAKEVRVNPATNEFDRTDAPIIVRNGYPPLPTVIDWLNATDIRVIPKSSEAPKESNNARRQQLDEEGRKFTQQLLDAERGGSEEEIAADTTKYSVEQKSQTTLDYEGPLGSGDAMAEAMGQAGLPWKGNKATFKEGSGALAKAEDKPLGIGALGWGEGKKPYKLRGN